MTPIFEDVFLDIPNLTELLRFRSSIATLKLAQTNGRLTQEGVTHILKLCDALWLHSGDPKAPHAELPQGRCSNGFVDILRALCYTNVCDLLAYHMTHAIEAKLDQMEKDGKLDPLMYSSSDWVIGSDRAGSVFSHDVARWLGAKYDVTGRRTADGKEQTWKRFAISSSETVLQVEPLMTTGDMLMAVREGIRRGNRGRVVFAPFVGVLVHSSHVYDIEGAPVIYLAHYDISVWDSSECPLCAEGSQRLRPRQYWAELTGKKA